MRCSSSVFFFCLNSRLISVSNIPKSPVESGQRPSTDIRALTHSEEDTFFFFFWLRLDVFCLNSTGSVATSAPSCAASLLMEWHQ